MKKEMFAILIASFVLFIPAVLAESSSTEVDFYTPGSSEGSNITPVNQEIPDNSSFRTMLNIVAGIILLLIIWLFFFSKNKVKSHAVKSSGKKKRK